MPSIIVEEDVYRYLQAHAQPFEDTPSTVLRRLLGLNEKQSTRERSKTDTTRGTDGKRLPIDRKRGKTPQHKYEPVILEILKEKGGSAPAGEVLEEVHKRMKNGLTEADLEPLRGGEPRWRISAQWARHVLAKKGQLGESQPGTWALSDA